MWALIDQGVFSVANWGLQILLGRWMAEAAYGGFVLGWQWFLLLALVHNAFLLDPMLVHGPKRFKGRRSRYLGALIAVSLGTSLLCGVTMAAAAASYAALGQTIGAAGIAIFAAGMPVILIWWTLRRSSYIRSEPKPAALAGMLYLIIVVGALVPLTHLGLLGVPAAVGVLVLASLVAAVVVGTIEGVTWPRMEEVREAARLHWHFGKWTILGGLAVLLPERIYYFVLPLAFGEQGTVDAGALMALQNFFVPFIQIAAATTGIVTPTFLRAEGAGLRKLLMVVAGVMVGLPTVWAGLMLFVGPQLVGFAYGGKYLEHANLLPILSLVPAIGGITLTIYPMLASREKVYLLSLAGGAGVLFSATAGVWLLITHGLVGAAWAMVGSATATAVFAAVLSWPVLNSPAPMADDEEETEGDA
jgi:O-antigen/teichoic acid export membrane protein